MKAELTKKEKLRDKLIKLRKQAKEMMKVWQSMDEEGWEGEKSACQRQRCIIGGG